MDIIKSIYKDQATCGHHQTIYNTKNNKNKEKEAPQTPEISNWTNKHVMAQSLYVEFYAAIKNYLCDNI